MSDTINTDNVLIGSGYLSINEHDKIYCGDFKLNIAVKKTDIDNVFDMNYVLSISKSDKYYETINKYKSKDSFSLIATIPNHNGLRFYIKSNNVIIDENNNFVMKEIEFVSEHNKDIKL